MAEGTDDFIKENEELQATLETKEQMLHALQQQDGGTHTRLMDIIHGLQEKLSAKTREADEVTLRQSTPKAPSAAPPKS